MDREEAKKIVVEHLEKKSTTKTKFYLSNFYELLPDMSPRQVSKLLNEMVRDGTLEYWSSGSTTMFGMKGVGKQHQEDSVL